MKVIDNQGTVAFYDDLNYGDTFRYDGKIYMKTAIDGGTISVDIFDGTTINLRGNYCLTQVFCEVSVHANRI